MNSAPQSHRLISSPHIWQISLLQFSWWYPPLRTPQSPHRRVPQSYSSSPYLILEASEEPQHTLVQVQLSGDGMCSEHKEHAGPRPVLRYWRIFNLPKKQMGRPSVNSAAHFDLNYFQTDYCVITRIATVSWRILKDYNLHLESHKPLNYSGQLDWQLVQISDIQEGIAIDPLDILLYR